MQGLRPSHFRCLDLQPTHADGTVMRSLFCWSLREDDIDGCLSPGSGRRSELRGRPAVEMGVARGEDESIDTAELGAEPRVLESLADQDMRYSATWTVVRRDEAPCVGVGDDHPCFGQRLRSSEVPDERSQIASQGKSLAPWTP